MTYSNMVKKVNPKNVVFNTEMILKENKIKQGMQNKNKVELTCEEQNEVKCKEKILI